MIENVLIQVLRLVLVDKENQNFNLVFLGSGPCPCSESRKVWMEKSSSTSTTLYEVCTEIRQDTLMRRLKIKLNANLVGRKFGAQTQAIKPC